MRKFFIGLLVGVGLMMAFSASAAVESIIGKTVDGVAPITLDGKKLDKNVVIIEGSSYAPVRDIGEALNREVDFKNGEIILSRRSREVEDLPKIKNGPETVEDYELLINSRNERVSIFERQLLELKRNRPEEVDKIKLGEQQLQDYKNETADLEKQKAELLK